MPMTHTVLTFISRVKPEEAGDLRELLQQIEAAPATALVPFGQLKSLHFASFVLHEPTKEEEERKYGRRLVFENNFDGTLDRFLDDLYDKAGPGLHQIYRHCEDYSITNAGDRQGMQAYLKSHVVKPNAYHIGNTGRSAPRIFQEQELRDALELRADALVRDGKPTSPEELFDSLKKFVDTRPQFSPLPDVGPRQTWLQRFLAWANLVLQGLLALALIILLLPLVIILALVLIHKEKTDSVKSGAADNENIRKLVESEDHTHSVQNHMASITIVKSGWLRRLALW